jgi:hypothetical protein
MNISLKWITLIGGAVLSGVLLVALLVGTALAQGPAPRGGQDGYGWGGYGPGGMMGRGMMGGYGGMMGGGMMGGWGNSYPTTGSRLTLDQTVEAVEQYLAAYGNPDLALAEVMEFSNNFYAEVEEQSTGIHAFELLINPYTGVIYPEPGPNMMWNTRYGHMGSRGGMMGGWWGYGAQSPATGEMAVGPEAAVQAAQAYLDQVQPGLTADDQVDAFYGYYTLHALRDGQVVGMLSVNGNTGQVWYHTWHGDFVGMTDGHEE